jgi:hypothetical protein
MSAFDPKRTLSVATNDCETSPTASVEEMLLAPFLKSKMASLAVRNYRRWIFAQQKLERFFPGAISFPDSLKIIMRILDWTGSAGPVNLPPPWLRRFCPVFHDNGKVLIPQHKNHNTAEISAAVEKLRQTHRSERRLLRDKRTWHGDIAMSAYGPNQTWPSAPHMSAFGGKADMAYCKCPLMTQSGHEPDLKGYRDRIGQVHQN